MTYWEKRKEALYSQLEKDELSLRKRLLKTYQAESARLDKEIASYFSRYGEENVIEYRQLLQKLDPEDQALLFEQWDEFAKKYPQYQELMPIRTSIYQLDRLQGLQYSISLQQLELGAVEQSMIEEHLNKTARRAANATMETLGFGKNFYAIDSDVVKLFVGTNWSGDGDFSSRIWRNKEKISNYVNTDLAQGFARGDSYARLVKDIQSRFLKVSKNDAYRLVYTEGSFVANEASMYAFQEYFTEYSIETMGDGKVCPICRAIADQSKLEPFNIENRTPGENFPPFHPWCRCTFKIEVSDWNEWMDNYVATGGNPKQARKIAENLESLEGKVTADSTKLKVVKEDKIARKNNLSEAENLFNRAGVSIGSPINNEYIYSESLKTAAVTLDKLQLKYNGLNLRRQNSVYFEDVLLENGKIPIAAASRGNDIYLSLSKYLNIEPEDFVAKMNLYIKKNQYMPARVERLAEYPVTHEYGHVMFHNILETEVEKRKGPWSPLSDWDFSEEYEAEKTTQLNIICDIVKKQNGLNSISEAKILIASQLSTYGGKNIDEFFAEGFANSELGKPNVVGKAIAEYIRTR